MRWSVAATVSFALSLFAGCGTSSSGGSDESVKDDLLRGIAQIRGSHDPSTLNRQLATTLAKLRRDPASTAAGRAARRLATQGFVWTRKGVKARLDFLTNDSGNVEAATRDAMRADRYLNRGARLLRAAGRRFGIRIGTLNGH